MHNYARILVFRGKLLKAASFFFDAQRESILRHPEFYDGCDSLGVVRERGRRGGCTPPSRVQCAPRRNNHETALESLAHFRTGIFLIGLLQFFEIENLIERIS